MSASNELLAIRSWCWERAKGELRGYLKTYFPEYGRDGHKIDDGFEEAEARIEIFIEEFEKNFM